MKKVLIIILSVLVVGLASYIVYDKFINNKEPIEEPTNDIEIKEYTLEDFDDVMKQLIVLVNKKSLNEMENRERLRILINSSYGSWENDTISQDVLDRIHEHSVIKHLPVVYEDLPISYGNFIWSDSDVSIKYDKDSKTFTSIPDGHGGVEIANIIYKDLVSFSSNNGKYTIKYKYIFDNLDIYDYTDDTANTYKFYYTANDAINDVNSFATLSLSVDTDLYFKNHYNEIKDKLKTYTYVFEIEDGDIVITDFSVE